MSVIDRCSTKVYAFYIDAHLFKNCFYSICVIIGKLYKYITPFYINCKEKYFANSKNYKILKAAKLV